jgi:phosphate transport system permease protein
MQVVAAPSQAWEATTRRSRFALKERLIHVSLFLCATISIATTAGIIFVLGKESLVFFTHVSPIEFFTGVEWAPTFEQARFGVLPLITGTFLIAAGALVIALPIGLGSAVFMSEYAPSGLRSVLKPTLEILAGVPSVVYGYFALMFVTPHLLRPLAPGTEVFNAASAAIVVGVMIIPTISSLCDDALRAVPRHLREAAYALSATKLEVSTRIVVPAALSGVTAAVLLGFARAVGETMAVAIAAGMTPNFTLDPFQRTQTLTGFMVQISQGDTPAGSVAYLTIFAVGATLFVITLTINFFAYKIFQRFREVYD